MFKKTRLRIFALIVAAATVIILLMLSVIYIANNRSRFERDTSLLEQYVQNEFREEREPHPDSDTEQGQKKGKHGSAEEHDKMLSVSTFYSVVYDNQEVSKVSNKGGALYSEQEILDIADSILASGKSSGTYNKTPFLVQTEGSKTIVALIDNTMEKNNSDRLFSISLLVGASSWVVILLLSWFLSKVIVNPLEQSDAKQKQFISDAGHELKTPISVISANADLLSAEIGENKWLANIQYENERMSNLIKQLLILASAENMQKTMERLDFSHLVSGDALPFESVAFENGLTLRMDIEDGVFLVGNSPQLSQLVSIFMDNAIEHGKDGKEITVKLQASKHHAVFSVINSGQAIPDGIKDRLFERFYRVDEARTDSSGHYGLGLAIAKAIVCAHGGSIDVKCEDGLVEFSASIPQNTSNH